MTVARELTQPAAIGSRRPGVTVGEVTPISPGARALLGSAIDCPGCGWSSSGHALEVRGWALGADAPVTRIDVVSRRQLIQSIPTGHSRADIAALHPDCPWAESSGYRGWIGTVILEAGFELELRARFADGETVHLGQILGECSPFDTGYAPALSPLTLTSLGRSGSTALMHLLSHMDAVVCGNQYPYELRIAKYWTHLLTVAASQADYMHSVNHDSFHESAFRAGRNPFHDTQIGSLRDWLQTGYVDALAGSVQHLLDEAYGAIAAGRDVALAPVYFAEKSPPDRHPALMHRLYPGARELFLVRDFRDVYCSIAAFNRKRGYDGFGRDQVSGEAEYVRQLGGDATDMYEAWRSRGASGLLVRYEDLVADPVGVIGAIADYLEVPETHPEGVVDRASDTDESMRYHRTTATAADSIERWRRDLPAELLEECARSLDEALVGFGYAPTA